MQQAQHPSPISLFGTSLLFYVLLVLVMRIMGKREIASLSLLDLVVTSMIADAAIIAIEEDRYPVWVGLIPVDTIAASEIGMSYLMLKSTWLRTMIGGKPSVVISRGKIVEKELRSLRFNVDELLSQLRHKNVPDVADVEYAVLEPDGRLSMIPRADKRPLTPSDLGLAPPQDGLPITLVVDRSVDRLALARLGKDEAWLRAQLRGAGLSGPEEVLLCTVNAQGRLFVQPRAGVTPRPGRSPRGRPWPGTS